MSWALPLPAAVPLLAAALLIAAGTLLPRRLKDAVAIAAAATATAFSLAILVAAERRDVVHWFGGWHPRHGVALGISFAADPLGAGMAALSCGLATLVLAYSWTYMRNQTPTFDVLVLTLTAGMAGFSLTGDIFNMFVWFELMGVSAYALAGFAVEELGPLQAAINYAVSNTVGAYLVLTGIALLYARTGALNLAQLGRALAHRPADRLVIVAFALILTGLMVKAAIVPFHFWLADAYAASPAPVCALFAGTMVELAVFFIARVYWTVFAAPLALHHAGVQDVLVALGAVTALVGALMCCLQRHTKRLLAYATISNAGVLLTGVALLDPQSLAGAADIVVEHGLLRAGQFLLCGIVLARLRHVDELRLRGAGRALPLVGVLWLAATVGLLDVPLVGVWLGHDLLDRGASEHGFGWLIAVTTIATGVSAGAMLRAGARIFLGWGEAQDELLTPEPDEQAPEHLGHAGPMTVVTATAIVLGLAASAVPGLEERTRAAAGRFVDAAAYRAAVLHGAHVHVAPTHGFALPPVSISSVLYGLAGIAIAVLTAAWGLWHARLPAAVRAPAWRTLWPPVRILRDAHSGIIGDYLLWLAAGAVGVSAVWAVTL
jgi:multicomponent Na+:H+ antiporter subunit D